MPQALRNCAPTCGFEANGLRLVLRPAASRSGPSGRPEYDAYCVGVVSDGAVGSVAAGSSPPPVALSSQAARANTAKRAVVAVKRGLPIDAVRPLFLII